jgi:hypothetical protein
VPSTCGMILRRKFGAADGWLAAPEHWDGAGSAPYRDTRRQQVTNEFPTQGNREIIRWIRVLFSREQGNNSG